MTNANTDKIWIRVVELDSGRFVQFFANKTTGLVQADVIAANENGGVELLRIDANNVDLSHCEAE